MLLNINSIRECTESEGIGKRFAIWTQGCMKRCRNCCNTHMQPIIKKHIVDCDDIIKQIQYSKTNYNIEGITLLGGEPVLQSKGLSYIAKWCRENDLSVILFSGYTLEEINTSNFDGALELLKYTDVLIDGEYIDELYDEAQGLIFKLSEENAHTDAGPVPALTHAVKLLEKIQHDKDLGQRMTGIPSGFSELDELTSGLQPGSLNIVAARPGVGKTSFSMNIVENIAMNPDIHKPALVFSLEMPAQQIVLRMLSTFGRVSMRELSEGKVTTNQWHDIIRKVAMLTETDENNVKRNKLYIDDSGDVTPLEVRSRARKLAAEHGGLSVIMIDYIQLMKGQTKAENRSLEVGEISRSLKLLAKDLEVPVIALSQLNREVENRKDHRPMNSDLRESGSLEQDADMIMFLHREATYHGGGDGEDNGKALLIVSKNRNGAIKDIELQFQGAYTAFYDKANTVAMMDVPPIDDVLLQ